MSELGRDEDTPRRDWEREIYKREEVKMTEPTPRTDEISNHYSDTDPIPACYREMREHARSLERQCARQSALLREIDEHGGASVDVKKRIKAELKRDKDLDFTPEAKPYNLLGDY